MDSCTCTECVMVCVCVCVCDGVCVHLYTGGLPHIIYRSEYCSINTSYKLKYLLQQETKNALYNHKCKQYKLDRLD